MSDGDGLKRAIADNPADDAPRLVYSDWLADHGAPGEEDAVRTMMANPNYRAVIATEPEFGRSLNVMSRDGVPLVGVTRGAVEYVRLSVGAFVAALDILAALPVLVVDLLGVSPGAEQVDGRDYRFWQAGGHLAGPSWYFASPARLPDEVCRGLTAAVHHRAGRWRYSSGTGAVHGAPFDASRAAVRLLRERAGLRPVTDGEFRAAECRWAGSSLQAVSTGFVLEIVNRPKGVYTFNSVFTPVRGIAFRAFDGFKPETAVELIYPRVCPVNVPGSQWSNVRFEIGGVDPKNIATKVADATRAGRTLSPDPNQMDRFLRAAYLAGQEQAYAREKAALDAFLNTQEPGNDAAQEETPGAPGA